MGLKVSSQLGLLVGITVSALTLVGAFFFDAVSMLGRVNSVRSYEEEILSHVTTIYLSSNEIRRLETRILASRFDGGLADLEPDRQRMKALFENALAHLTVAASVVSNDERRSIMEDGQKQIGLYQRIVDSQLQKITRLGLGNAQGLLGEIETTRAEIAERLKTASLTAYMVMLEQWPEPRDMEAGTSGGLANVDAADFLAPVRAELQNALLPADQVAEIETLSRLYFSQLEALNAVNASLVSLRRSSEKLYHGLGDLMEELRADALYRVEDARSEYDRISGQMITIIVAALLFVAAGSILSGLFLGKRLSGQIRSISDISRRMAKGETGIAIPHLDMQNEIGDMARALNAFGETAEKLRQLNVGLEEKIAERTRELEVQTQRAEDGSKAKSSFLAHMSHEIRTPMNGVVGLVEILSSTDLTDGQRRLLETINESADHLLRVIDDILDVSKIEAGKLDLEEMEIDLLQLVERSIETFSSTARAGNVKLLNYCNPRVPRFVIGDPVRLRQIILNLVGNAVKFSKRVDGHAGMVQVYADLDDRGAIRLHVVDNGIGMSQQTIDGLFTAFQQADTSTARQFGGTGLGMKISNRLVTMMGGSIDVASTLGKGSEFTVNLPLKTAERQEARDDLGGARLLGFVDVPDKGDCFPKFFPAHGARFERVADRRDLLTAVAQAEDDPIVLLGSLAEGENDALLEDIRALGRGTKLLVLDPSRSTAKGMVSPGIYVSHRLPVHFGDILNGIQALRQGQGNRPETPVEQVGADAPAQAGGLPVLICEDNRINQDVLTRQLRMLGYACDLAGNGREGLEKWQKGQYGLILSDCHMPEMDGYAMTAAIREKEAGTGRVKTPIIAVTGNALKEESSVCFAAGMDGILTKPVKLDDLKAILEDWYITDPAVSGKTRVPS